MRKNLLKIRIDQIILQTQDILQHKFSQTLAPAHCLSSVADIKITAELFTYSFTPYSPQTLLACFRIDRSRNFPKLFAMQQSDHKVITKKCYYDHFL